MKSRINCAISVIFFVVTSTAAIADGHYNGQGFSSNVSSTTLEGKTGSIIHMINEDFWQYQNAPEGWPTAAMATCHFTMMIVAGEQAPSSINGVCESIDPDGDATVWTASVDPSTGIGKGNLVNGTGKYEGVQAFPTFQTTFQIDAAHSIYDFKW